MGHLTCPSEPDAPTYRGLRATARETATRIFTALELFHTDLRRGDLTNAIEDARALGRFADDLGALLEAMAERTAEPHPIGC